MKNEEFIDFLIEVGFHRSWQNKLSFSLTSDLLAHKKYCSTSIFLDSINVSVEEDKIIMTKSSISVSSKIINEDLGSFKLVDFNNDTKKKFLSIITSSLSNIPDSLSSYLRDRKIRDILD